MNQRQSHVFGWDNAGSAWSGSATEILRAIIERSGDLVYVCDHDSRFLLINELAIEVLGASCVDIIGQTASECLSGPAIHLSEPDAGIIESGQQAVVEGVLEHKGHLRIFESLKIPYRDQHGEVAGLINVSRDVTERQRFGSIMENLATRFASVSGAEFFNKLCGHICEVLSVDYAFVGRLISGNATVEVIAGAGNGQLLDPFEYGLAGTPCREVVGKEVCVFRSGVQEEFPDDALLVDMEIDGYVGIPLYTRTGEPLGIMVALSTRPIEDEQVASVLMTGYSERVAAEIQRTEAEEALRQKDRDIRKAYVDIFSAVTDEKLLILTEEEIEAAVGRRVSGPYKLDKYAELAGARAWLGAVLSTEGLSDDDISALVLAAGEAMTNAIKHGEDCTASVHRLGDIIQVYVSDHGSGIDFSDMPKATLLAGFSTKKSLGVGFSIILEICDRVLLSTGVGGTILVLETGGRKKANTIHEVLTRGSI